MHIAIFKRALAGSALAFYVAVALTACSTPAKEPTIVSKTYDLYGEMATAYSTYGKGEYEKRKPFYNSAKATVDVLEMRARVNVSAKYITPEEKLSKTQADYIAPFTDLRAALHNMETADDAGQLKNAAVYQKQRLYIDQIFFSILDRQSVGAKP